jgi:hypothetical protein
MHPFTVRESASGPSADLQSSHQLFYGSLAEGDRPMSARFAIGSSSGSSTIVLRRSGRLGAEVSLGFVVGVGLLESAHSVVSDALVLPDFICSAGPLIN